MISERERVRKKAWRAAHREQIAAYNKAWRQRNYEKHQAGIKAWREQHREAMRAKEKAYRQRNRVILKVARAAGISVPEARRQLGLTSATKDEIKYPSQLPAPSPERCRSCH